MYDDLFVQFSYQTTAFASWKVAEAIVLLKPGKPPNEVTSYRPILFQPGIVKVLDKCNRDQKTETYNKMKTNEKKCFELNCQSRLAGKQNFVDLSSNSVQ